MVSSGVVLVAGLALAASAAAESTGNTVINFNFDGCDLDCECECPGEEPTEFSLFEVGAPPLLPFPSDLFFVGSQTGLLNAPADNPTTSFLDGIFSTLSLLNGFSRSGPTMFTFSAPIDPATVTGRTVSWAAVSDDGTVVPLVWGTDYRAYVSEQDATVLMVSPLQPLAPGTTHLVVVKEGVAAMGGEQFARSAAFSALTEGITVPPSSPAYEGIAGAAPAFYAEVLSQVAAGYGRDAVGSVVVATRFTVQTGDAVLDAMVDSVASRPLNLVPTGINTGDLGLLGAADIYQGTLVLPTYQDLSNPLFGLISGLGGVPVTEVFSRPTPTGTIEIPVMATIPVGDVPEGGFRVLVYNHGLGSDRTELLGVADAMALTGTAVVGLDMPWHGANDTTNPFYLEGLERRGAAVSGELFFNLFSPPTLRDSYREMAYDLATLIASLGGSTIADMVDESSVSMGGLSLGGINSVIFSGLVNGADLDAVYSDNPAAGLPFNAALAPSFADSIDEFFMAVTLGQFGRDSAPGILSTMIFDQFSATVDPINAVGPAVRRNNLLLTQYDNDPTNINSAYVPLVGTAEMARVSGLERFSEAGVYGGFTGTDGYIRFNAGAHASLVVPEDPAVTAERQSIFASFVASGGTFFSITNDDVITPADDDAGRKGRRAAAGLPFGYPGDPAKLVKGVLQVRNAMQA